MRRTQKQLQEEIEKFKVYKYRNRWYGTRICPGCNKEIKHAAQESYLVLRNIRNLISEKAHCASCANSGSKNAFFGKKHTEKSKKQNSKSRTGKCCGINNPMANPIHRKAVSDALSEKYASGELNFLKAIQSKNATNNQANGKLKTAQISKAEKEIKILLEEQGYLVESQFGIVSLKYDLFVKNKNILIEYNGDYWHCNPKIYNADYMHKKSN